MHGRRLLADDAPVRPSDSTERVRGERACRLSRERPTDTSRSYRHRVRRRQSPRPSVESAVNGAGVCR